VITGVKWKLSSFGGTIAGRSREWLAFAIAMTAIGGGIFLAYMGKQTAGLGAVIAAVIGLVAVFFGGRAKQQSEVVEKSKGR
jgi:DMSO reductase anchor subunit